MMHTVRVLSGIVYHARDLGTSTERLSSAGILQGWGSNWPGRPDEVPEVEIGGVACAVAPGGTTWPAGAAWEARAAAAAAAATWISSIVGAIAGGMTWPCAAAADSAAAARAGDLRHVAAAARSRCGAAAFGSTGATGGKIAVFPFMESGSDTSIASKDGNFSGCPVGSGAA